MFSERLSFKHCHLHEVPRKLLPVSSVFCVALTIVCLAQSARAQQQVGFIVDVQGTWFLNNGYSKALTKGQSLPADSSIRIQSPSDFDHITITDLRGNPLINRRCGMRGQCDGWIALPAARAKRGWLSSGYGAVMSLIWGDPDRYAANRARDGELTDGVVELRGEQIDLSTVFQKSDKGEYHLRLRSLARDNKQAAGKRLGPVVFNWQAAHPAKVSIPDLKPGLYELTLLEQLNNTYTASGVTAWVLVKPNASYRRTSETFQAAVQMTKKWGS